VTRAATSADAWLIRSLLGPGRLAQRVHDLELSRALAVDDSAAVARRLERDLHDGAQIRLATLAMNLGLAREKLGDGGEVPDAAAARELIEAALRSAKDAGRRGGRPAHDRQPARRPHGGHRRATAARMNVRVVLAEDGVLFRAGLTRLIEDHGHRVCAAVGDGGALLGS
jgi:hypothetical protein